jgi:hypothetical protein
VAGRRRDAPGVGPAARRRRVTDARRSRAARPSDRRVPAGAATPTAAVARLDRPIGRLSRPHRTRWRRAPADAGVPTAARSSPGTGRDTDTRCGRRGWGWNRCSRAGPPPRDPAVSGSARGAARDRCPSTRPRVHAPVRLR